jgi:hypothetical protein
MWPNLFGHSWIWGILVTLAMLCIIFGGLGLMFYLLQRPTETPDPFDRIWHRFEEGDLTREEFERLRQGAGSG